MIGRVIYLVLSPHLADPTLTTDNFIEVMKEEKHRWEDLAHKLGLLTLGLLAPGMRGMEDVVDEYLLTPGPPTLPQPHNPHNQVNIISLVPRPFNRLGFDCLQYVKMEREGLVQFITRMTSATTLVPYFIVNDVSVYLGRQREGGGGSH